MYFLWVGKVGTLEDQTLLWQASDLKNSRKIIFYQETCIKHLPLYGWNLCNDSDAQKLGLKE